MRYRSDLDIRITGPQEQLILGTLLGDASCVLQKGARNPYITVAHSFRDRRYTEWKYDYLRSTNLLQSPISKRGVLCTIQHPKLHRFYNLFYSNGVKVVTKEVLKLLQPLGLAVWFMDDGSLTRKISRSSGPYYVLAASCFTVEECELIRSWLLSRYGIAFRVYIQKKKGYDKVYPYLATTRVVDGRLFARLVSPYIHSSMIRKKAVI